MCGLFLLTSGSNTVDESADYNRHCQLVSAIISPSRTDANSIISPAPKPTIRQMAALTITLTTEF